MPFSPVGSDRIYAVHTIAIDQHKSKHAARLLPSVESNRCSAYLCASRASHRVSDVSSASDMGGT